MKKSILLGICIMLLVAGSAFAQVGKGLSGPHFNLNIIGVPHDKVADMTDSHRHTIFVPLDSGEDVPRQVKIFYVINEDNPNQFEVLDGNATDGEATIAVPYEYCGDLEAGCYDMLNFDVYAVGLGKPNTSAVVTAECTYSVDPGVDVLDENDKAADCTDTLLMGSFTITREKKNPKPINISNIFRASGCFDQAGEEGVCDSGDIEFRNIWVFNLPELDTYFWDYDNNGLKVMQVRFYETSEGDIYIK